MSREQLFIESGLINPFRNAFLLPVSLLVKFTQACAIDDPVNTLAAMATEMQLFAGNFVDDQVSVRDRQVAVNACVGCDHKFTD
jgi:hypothetical protein